MKLKTLNQRPGIKENEKLNKVYLKFGKLLQELEKRELSDTLTDTVNEHIEAINSISDSDKKLGSQIRRKQSVIVRLVEKELKLVPRNYYRTTWMAIGMAAFGVPMGAALGASLGNMAFIGIGLPIGMAIGIAVGSGMDKKASDEGRQLDLEM